MAAVMVVVLAFTWKLVEFQVVRAAEINKISKEKRSVTRTLPALRGSIEDNQGNIHARSVYRYDINAAPINVAPIVRTTAGGSVEVSVDQQATELAQILGQTKEEILTKIAGQSNYSNLDRKSVV